MQLALTGVRDLSIIASAPVDRLAVRTFIAPFDPIVVREALLRERYRGGQAFYVSPRIEDLAEVKAYLDQTVPEARVAVAHGQMPAGMLEDIMSAFYDGKYDVLLSTTIIESGLDIPTANTLIVHRADMFGLSQLYQLRGRVGRAKTRAYALFTLPVNKRLTTQAERRLKVLQSLDTLGAGFQLASHDLDIRGAGNLLGEEQSGHIKEVGFELYQQMLEEAVMSMKAGGTEAAADRWSPQITIGMAVLIPEDYVADLSVRLGLYRRLADLDDDREIDAFGAELADRFGPLPEEVQHLLQIVAIKALCRRANVEKVDTGPKGAVLSFRDNMFSNPAGLLQYIQEEGPDAKVRPDMKVVFFNEWAKPEQRLKGTTADPAHARGHRGAEKGGVIEGMSAPQTQWAPLPLEGRGWGWGSFNGSLRDPHPGALCAPTLPARGRVRTPSFAASCIATLFLLSSNAAFAHTGESAGGFLAGLAHPVFGPDHVVAMVAVGLWGAFLGPPAIWLLPIVFPLVMAAGGVLGILGVPLPAVETGIASSAIVLGLMVALAARPPLWIAAVLVGAFAIFHGYAHGKELPDGAERGRVLGRLRHRDGPPASHRHRVRPAHALACWSACSTRGRGRDCADRRGVSRRLRMTAFFGGALQFFIPSHLLAVVALGLLAGQHAPRFPLRVLAPFTMGLIVGSLIVAYAIRENPASLGLLTLATVAAGTRCPRLGRSGLAHRPDGLRDRVRACRSTRHRTRSRSQTRSRRKPDSRSRQLSFSRW